jgi:hypothetical protein
LIRHASAVTAVDRHDFVMMAPRDFMIEAGPGDRALVEKSLFRP